jgi:hypothetical protein
VTAIRTLERNSIERFLTDNADKLQGRVLDIGCGQQPYRNIVESFGGEYIGYDRAGHAGSVTSEDIGDYWDLVEDVDTAMMTQVWQYIPTYVLRDMLSKLASGDWSLKPGGWYLATGPTNWPLVEMTDLHRFTVKGVEGFLDAAGFREIHVEERASIEVQGERWPLGWKAVARARS